MLWSGTRCDVSNTMADGPCRWGCGKEDKWSGLVGDVEMNGWC